MKNKFRSEIEVGNLLKFPFSFVKQITKDMLMFSVLLQEPVQQILQVPHCPWTVMVARVAGVQREIHVTAIPLHQTNL